MNPPPSVLAATGCVAIVLCLLSGCSVYEAKPLDKDAIAQGLKAPDPGAIQIAASSLKHPLVAPMTIDGRDGFSPDEIAVMVVIVSPELRALRDQRGVAQAQIVQAGILPNPQLSWSLDKPRGNSDPTLVAAKSLGLSWDFTSLLTRNSQVASAKAAAKSLDLSVAWQEWQASQDARLRAFRILSIEERLPLARSVEAAQFDTVNLTRKAVQLGHKTLPDLTAATEAWTTAQNARFDLEQQVVAERADLNLSLGLPPSEVVRLKPAAVFPEISAPPSADDLLGDLEDRRLDLVALRFGYESQEDSVHAAVLAQFPKIGLSVNKAQDTTPVKTVGYGVSVDIPLFDRNQGQIAIGKATRQQLFDEYLARLAEARSQVGQVLANLAVLKQQLAAVDQSLPDLAELNRSFETALKERNADVLAARDAQASLATRQMERSSLRQEELEQAVALEIATGRPLLNRQGPEALTPSAPAPSPTP